MSRIVRWIRNVFRRRIEIKDIIIHGPCNQISIIVSRYPDFRYEFRGPDYLLAEDDGFYNSYGYEEPDRYSRAFAGRKFDIPLKDGGVVKAHGQWWAKWSIAQVSEPTIIVGVSTIEMLHQCYVFMSMRVKKSHIDEWMKRHAPASDYYKYNKKKD